MSTPEPSQPTEGTEPTRRAGGAGPIVAGVAAVLLVAALVAWLSLRGGADAKPASSDEPAPTQPAASSAASGASDPTSETPTSDATTEQPAPSLPPEVGFAKAAKQAVKAGVPALVPDAFGDRVGVVTAADFTDGLWQLTVTTETGEVVVRQDAGAADALVERFAAGSRPKGTTDLEPFGLGTWQRYAGAEGAVLATDLPDGGVVATGPDQATVLAVVRTLLTYEPTGPTELG
ncbi:hypothetical protein GCM10023340_27310 [Nocardioides marinquilinus]|uniref:Secreted protein n=1 Tax=Nocardioides marinquilinus TaxID=1210400 RepID=A0ABP9PUA1_9ACTN